MSATAAAPGASASEHPGRWGHLPEPLLLQILGALEPGDAATAHLVSRAWRDAVRLTTRQLRFRGAAPDTERLRQVRPAGAGVLCAGLAMPVPFT